MKKYTFLVAVLVSLFASPVFSQAYKFTKKKQYVSIGGSINTMNYFGDLAPTSSIGSTDFSLTKPNLDFYVQKRFTPRVSARLSLGWGQLSGDDASVTTLDVESFGRPQRNLHFRSNIIQTAFQGIIDIIPNQGTYYRRPQVPIPYLIGGISILYHRPEAVAPERAPNGATLAEFGEWISLRELQTEGQSYSPFTIAIPLGIGVRYKLTRNVDIGIEASIRYAFTDYLDDVSENYPDMTGYTPLQAAMTSRALEPVAYRTGEPRTDAEIPTDGLVNNGGYSVARYHGGVGSQRGNPDNNDAFSMIGLHINYIISGALKAPKFR